MTDSSIQTVLVTGGAGYIGSAVVRLILHAGQRVRVLDALEFGGEPLLDLSSDPNFEFVRADIRDRRAVTEALRGTHAVAHLAAIVGDPACSKRPDLARSVNLSATTELYELAQSCGTRRFVFASTCSNYGRMLDPKTYVDETAPLEPISLYAETKVAAERFLLSQPLGARCIPTCLRFSTVYGLSLRPRFDLTLNEFTKELALGRELLIYGKQFWRPYCHVHDLARSVVTVLQAPEEAVAFEVFNVGDTSQNFTKGMLVESILREVPNGRVRYIEKDEDPRDYRVSFEKIGSDSRAGVLSTDIALNYAEEAVVDRSVEPPASVEDVVIVHLAAFPGFFMTLLGPKFLQEYYRYVVEYHGGLVLTETDNSRTVGFVSGFIDPASFYVELKRRRTRLALAAMRGIAARPYAVLSLFENYRRADGFAAKGPGLDTAELSSLGVHPDARGRGVGSTLVRRFIDQAAVRGGKRVVLTTDARGNELANRFYQRLGFRCARTFETRRGRVLNEYIIDATKG